MLIQLFNPDQNQVCVCFYRTVSLGHAGAEDITKAVVNCFEEDSVPWEKLKLCRTVQM